MNIPLLPTQQTQSILIDIKDHHVIDILNIPTFKLNYDIIEKSNYIQLSVQATIQLDLACSKTLKPVPYEMDIDTEITFGDLDDCDFIYSKTININDILLGIIVSEKPYVIYHKDALDETTSS
jgi:uncharacterized protein